MKQQYFNRYGNFIINGEYRTLPFISLSIKNTDIYDVYIKNKTRLDILSQKYYDNPLYEWLILLANPIFSSLEFSIPDNVQIRIPYPLDITLQEYKDKINTFNTLYGV